MIGLVGAVFGQSELLTKYHGKWVPVVQVRLNRPFVDVDGKLRAGDGDQYILHEVDEYLPMFVSIQTMEAKTEAVDTGGTLINHEFKFRAGLKSAFALEDVFIVLEMTTADAGKSIFVQEIGDLASRESRAVEVNFHLNASLGEGRYHVRLFSHGKEVLHSNLGAGYCDNVLDVMTAKRIASVRDAAPKLFVGPEPEYPASLFKQKISGRVVVSLRIAANGRVYDPIVRSSPDPAFSEAAIEAVRLWRFFPRVKEGRPEEIRVGVPIDFAPPPETRKG